MKKLFVISMLVFACKPICAMDTESNSSSSKMQSLIQQALKENKSYNASTQFKVNMKRLAKLEKISLSSKLICELSSNSLGEKWSSDIPLKLLFEATEADTSYLSLGQFETARMANIAASSYNDVSLIKILLEGDIISDIDKKLEKTTALYEATIFDLKEMIQLLVDHGANPRSKNNNQTPLDRARSNEVTNILLKKIRYNKASSCCLF